MNEANGKVLALIGAALLAVGAFLPVLWVPIRGTTELMDLGQAGIVLLVLAGIALLLALIDWTRHAVWPGIGALLLLAYAYIQVQKRIAQAQQGLSDFDLARPLDILRGAVAANARLEWGWAVLVLGALLVLGGGALGWRRRG